MLDHKDDHNYTEPSSAYTDGRRCLDLVETEFDIPVLGFLLEVFISKERFPRDIMTKVESNPQSLVLP